MQQNDDNSLIPVPIASQAASGNVATIPTTQATAGDGRVSIDLGYPPECAISVAAGGKYPEMQDANGVYKLLSSAIRAIQAWGILPFNATFATAIGGYPKYAVCVDSAGAYWVSTADSNTTTPGADGAKWQSLFDGYATESWANSQFLKLSNSTNQTVISPVTFGKGIEISAENSIAGPTGTKVVFESNGHISIWSSDGHLQNWVGENEEGVFSTNYLGIVNLGVGSTVPDISDFTGEKVLNARTADARYIKSVPAAGQTRITSLVENADGRAVFGGGTNNPVLALLSDLPMDDPAMKLQAFYVTPDYGAKNPIRVSFPRAFKPNTVPVVMIPNTQEMGSVSYWISNVITGNNVNGATTKLLIDNEGFSIGGYVIGPEGGAKKPMIIPVFAAGYYA